jgi:hypothetical protein
MMEPEETWERVPREMNELLASTGFVQVATSRQRPMSPEEGSAFAVAMAHQGFFVEIAAAKRSPWILVKVWEDFDEGEPTWEEIENSVRPVLKFDFQTTPGLYLHCESIVDELVRRHHYNDFYAVELVNRVCQGLFVSCDDREALLEKRSAHQWAHAFANSKPAAPNEPVRGSVGAKQRATSFRRVRLRIWR